MKESAYEYYLNWLIESDTKDSLDTYKAFLEGIVFAKTKETIVNHPSNNLEDK